VTVSIGVTAWSAGQPLSPQALLETADRALYRVKRQGRNGVEAAMASELVPDRQVA
jgi:diguanylate cyclase (GGDEF)-like protein